MECFIKRNEPSQIKLQIGARSFWLPCLKLTFFIKDLIASVTGEAPYVFFDERLTLDPFVKNRFGIWRFFSEKFAYFM